MAGPVLSRAPGASRRGREFAARRAAVHLFGPPTARRSPRSPGLPSPLCGAMPAPAFHPASQSTPANRLGMELPMITRRLFLALPAAWAAARASTVPLCHVVAYRIDAVIVLFSRPIFTRKDVGEGMIFRDEHPAAERTRMRFAFAGGSRPERARGLNRFGYFSELVGPQPSNPSAARYFGFMTRSDEKNLSEASRSLDPGHALVPISAIQGELREGRHRARLDSLQLDPGASWSVWPRCLASIARSLDPMPDTGPVGPAGPPASTFLHTVSRILENAQPRGETPFLYGSHPRSISWRSAPDKKAAAAFASLGLIAPGRAVLRFDLELLDRTTRSRSRFALWCDPQARPSLPLRIELQPRSFLRLRLEAVPGDTSLQRIEMENAFSAWSGLDSDPLHARL